MTAEIERVRGQEFVTVTELALLVQASAKTIRRRIEANRLKGVIRDGRFIRINRVIAVHHWLKGSTS